MRLFNQLAKVVSTAALLAAGCPQASAQSQSPMPQSWLRITQPTNFNDPNTVLSKVKGWDRTNQGPAQQGWRFTKGRDYDKLPPEFQWDTAPTPVNTPFPVYPYELLRREVAGKVRAYFVIGPDGRVAAAEFEEDARPEFARSVRAMLDHCRFNPAKKKDGTPASAYVGIEYNFQPRGRSDVPVDEGGRLILRDLEKQPGNILNLGDLDEPLKPRSRPPPVYPVALQKEMPAGDAEVEFFVDQDGHVQLPHVKTASAPEFGYAAVQAVATWWFEAPRKKGKAVVVRATVPIEFAGRKTVAAQK